MSTTELPPVKPVPIKPGTFNAKLQAATAEIEAAYLDDLAAGYEKVLASAGRRLARAFRAKADVLTAAAGDPPRFVPPNEDEIMDADKLAEDLARRTAEVRDRARDALADELARQGISFDVGGAFSSEMMDAVGQRAIFATDNELRGIFRGVVEEALTDGWSVPRTATAINQQVQAMAPHRATALARTDLIGVSNHGSQKAAEQTFSERADIFKTWQATADFRTRPDHMLAHGMSVPLKETYIVGGEPIRYPGDPFGSDENTINCFPGETLVTGFTARMGFRRWYDGDLIRVETDGFHNLAGTPNHPVLTDSGWKRLSELKEGDNLVCASGLDVDGAGVAHPDVDQAPAAIQDVFAALSNESRPARVTGVAVQFHGDGAEGEVEVVSANGSLSRELIPTLAEHLLEGGFVGTNEVPGVLSSASAERNVLVATGHTADGLVGSAAQSPPLLRRGLGHADEHRLGTVARLDSHSEQSPADSGATDAVAFGQSLLGDTFEVGLTEVVKIEWEEFHGDVFNLETESGAYVAYGILCHNCRCTQIYGDSPGSAVVKKGQENPLAGVQATAQQRTDAKEAWDNSWMPIRAVEHQISPEQYMAQLEEKVRAQIAVADVRIRAPVDIAAEILRDGEFQNQFTSGSSQGVYSTSRRATNELALFSIERDAPGQERPKYGYLGGLTRENQDYVGTYGEVSFVMKPEVKERTTWTSINSLESPIVPSPVLNPSVLSVDPRQLGANDLLTVPMKEWRSPYIEAQIHGPLSTADVQRIDVFYNADETDGLQLAEETADRLRRAAPGVHVDLVPWEPLPKFLGGSAEQRPDFADDGLLIDPDGFVPVASSDDGGRGKLGTDGLEALVVDPNERLLDLLPAATGEQHEVRLAPDTDDFHTGTIAPNAVDNRQTGYRIADNEEAQMAVTEVETTMRWRSEIAFENHGTSDGRFMLADSLDWRDPPLTLMAMVETTEGGHLGAQVAGKMESFRKVASSFAPDVMAVLSEGAFSEEEYGAMIARMVANEELTGISVDLMIHEFAFRDPETGAILEKDELSEAEWERVFNFELDLAVRSAEILAATVCPTPAFAEAKIALTASASGNRMIRPGVWLEPDGQMRSALIASISIVEDTEPLTAAGAGLAPLAPPREWFETSEPPGVMPLTVNDEGRVYGHLADWTTCHTGIPGTCTTAPRSPSGYAVFHVGEVVTEEGDVVFVGKLMLGTKHAGLSASKSQASQHYDDTGMVAAYVRAIDGKHGIWLAGAVKHDLPEHRLAELRANPLSGDWRGVNGKLELVAALAVPVPGFPIPRAQVNLEASAGEVEVNTYIASAGEMDPPTPEVRRALVAAGICQPDDEGIEALADL